jgi:ribosome biogenesis GTPase / thiamine phosphate phosphatase
MSEFKGLVVKSTGSWYRIWANGAFIDVRAAGKIRLKGLKTTNPIAVGDMVVVRDDLIQEVEERKNYLIRRSTNLSKQYHILAANLDAAVLVASITKPRIAPGFIDRFLINAEAYQVPAIVVINKIDLVDADHEELEDLAFLYRSIGYPVYLLSTETADELPLLVESIVGKTVLFTGFSGVGKSTLLNRIDPSFEQKTGEISVANEKGKHTTTFAEMFLMEDGTKIIDTPGIKEMGLVDFEAWELSHFFPEMKKYSSHCKYNNCIHKNEPGCAVKKAVEEFEIHPFRYQNYLSMMDENFNSN